MRTAICIPSFNGVERLSFFLRTVKENDPTAFDKADWLIVEDPSGYLGVTEGYVDLCDEYNLPFTKLNEWSNMHGAAQKAFNEAIEIYNPEWIIYQGDDNAVTPGALTNMIDFVERNDVEDIGLFQPAYWNAHELRPDEGKDWFFKDTEWTRDVQRNPHWDKEGYSVPYINVNGVGFLCNVEMFKSVGGFAPTTWCLDESISYKCWTRSDYSVMTLPGPPLVHYFGASYFAKPPKHEAWDPKLWVDDFGLSKEDSDRQMRRVMERRNDELVERAKKWVYV